MKYAFESLISRLNTAEKIISEIEDMSIQILQIEVQKEKVMIKKRTKHLKTVGQFQKGQHMHYWNRRTRRRRGRREGEGNGAEKYLSNNSQIFSKINDRYQITDPGISKKIKFDKYQNIYKLDTL